MDMVPIRQSGERFKVTETISISQNGQIEGADKENIHV